MLHGSVLVPLWAVDIPLPVAVAVTVLVMCTGFWSIYRDGLLAAAGSIESIAIDGSHCVAISLRSGSVLYGNVAERTLVTARLVILSIRTQVRRPLSRVVIAADMTDPEAFRRLRVLLRWAPDSDSPGRKTAAA
jgi:membrane-bound toxin of toxin-antitoxin system